MSKPEHLSTMQILMNRTRKKENKCNQVKVVKTEINLHIISELKAFPSHVEQQIRNSKMITIDFNAHNM